MEGVDYLADERKKAAFDVEAMKIVWAGSRDAFEVSDRISKLVANDPEISAQMLMSILFHWFCFFKDELNISTFWNLKFEKRVKREETGYYRELCNVKYQAELD
ncbi:UNVERIFIED_CONTAM: Peroxisomal acyl-coenzyme A oxidase 1 [Sesamum calycinum]|uniref:Peroxisomal acyl-coenzyme A oxidase 1 n=1 Tax=Sesamum calycinum TaxID=2727403 RepID=A0AAW2M0K5_9LAMI